MKKIKGFGAIEILIALLIIACLSVFAINHYLKKIDNKTQTNLQTTQEEINQKIDKLMQQREDLEEETERKFEDLEEN